MLTPFKHTAINALFSCMVGPNNYIKVSIDPNGIASYVIGNRINEEWKRSDWISNARKCLGHLEALFNVYNGGAEYDDLREMLGEIRRVARIK